MERKLDKVTDCLEWCGQTAYFETEEEAIKATEEDYFKNAYFYLSRTLINNRPMYQCHLYTIDYDYVMNNVIRKVDSIYDKLYKVVSKNDPNELLEHLDKIEKYIDNKIAEIDKREK